MLFARFVISVALRFHESRLPCQEKSFRTSFFLSAFRESNTQRNRDGTTFRTLVVASDTTLCKCYLLALLFQSLCAFTSRVSPANRSPLGLLFFWHFYANRTRNVKLTTNIKAIFVSVMIIFSLPCKRQTNCVQYKYEKES